MITYADYEPYLSPALYKTTDLMIDRGGQLHLGHQRSSLPRLGAASRSRWGHCHPEWSRPSRRRSRSC